MYKRLLGIREFLTRTARFIKQVVRWLCTPPIIAILASLLVVIATFSVSACLERSIRLSGMCLQLLGVVLTGCGLRDTRRAFEDQPTLMGHLRNWRAKRPRFAREHHELQTEGVSLSVSVGSARLKIAPGPNTPLDERVSLLERQYSSLSDEITNLASATKAEAKKLSDRIDSEKNQRQSSVVELRKQLKKAVAEGIPLASVGVAFFLLGISAGTASIEISKSLGGAVCP